MEAVFRWSTRFSQPSLTWSANLSVLESLLPQERESTRKTDSGHFPLMTVACFGNVEAADELLRLGADATLRNKNGKTVVMLAFERSHDKLAQSWKRDTKRAS